MSNKCWNKTSEIMPPVKEKVLIVYQNCIYMGHVFHDEDFGYR